MSLTIHISLNQDEDGRDVYEIRSPYNEDLIFLIKQVPGRKYVKERRVWTVPKNKLGFLLKELKGTQFEDCVYLKTDDEQIGENAALATTKSIPNIDVSQFQWMIKDGCAPFQHQTEFLQYAVDRMNRGRRSGFILGDDMGLGKSLQSVNLAKYRYDNKVPGRCLIVCCVNSAKYNFVDDIKKHSNGAAHPYLLGSRLCKVGPRKGLPRKGDPSMAEKLEDLVSGKMYGGDFGDKKLPFYLVVNIEAFRYRVKKKYPFTEQVAKMCNSGQISMIIIDEVHKNMGPTSTQGKQMLALKKMLTRPTMFLPMTGTIILNRPTDAFLPLRLVDGHNYNSFYTWQQEFCVFGGFGGKEVIAYKNIPKMKEMLEANMLGRKKEDVLDLPEKIYITEYVENGPYQQKLYDQVATDVITQKLSIVADMNPLARFMRLRQVNSAPEIIDPSINVMDKSYLSKNAKLARCLELIEDAVEAGGKVLVFSNWVEPLRTLYKYTTQRWKTCCYTGTMSEADREKHKQTFINNPEYKVMLGTVGAMGVSHTFTVAQTLIFYDEPWTAGDKQQCADRVHRIGITGSPNIITLITKDTIDERVHHIVYQKEGISDFIVDDKLDIYSNPELFDLLLSDTVKNS